MTNIITLLTNKLIKIWLKYRIQSKFNKIKELTSNDSLDLFIFFDRLYEHYSLILKSKGFEALWIEVKAVRDEIKYLNFNMLDKRHKTLSEKTIQGTLPHLNHFKDILTKVKFTVELLLLVKIILAYINKFAFIPILLLAILILIRKISVAFSLLFTSSFLSIYLTNHYDYISKTQELLFLLKLKLKNMSLSVHNWLFNDDLVSRSDIQADLDYIKRTLEVIDSLSNNGIIEILRGLSIKAHNWLYNDDLVSRSELESIVTFNEPSVQHGMDQGLIDKAQGLIPMINGWCSYVYNALPSAHINFNWSYVGYGSVSLLLIGTAYSVGTGILTPTASFIYSGIKTVGSALLSIFTYWSDDEDPSLPSELIDKSTPSALLITEMINKYKIYKTSLELNCGNAIDSKAQNEAFILDTLTEISQLSELKLEMIKIRLTYLNKEGKRSIKLILTSSLININSFPLLMGEFYDRCNLLGIELDRVKKVHLHLILIPTEVSTTPKNLFDTILPKVKWIGIILEIIEYIFPLQI